MHVIIRCMNAMASYTASEALELLLGEEESGEETDIKEDPKFPLPTTNLDSEEEDEDNGTYT